MSSGIRWATFFPCAWTCGRLHRRLCLNYLGIAFDVGRCVELLGLCPNKTRATPRHQSGNRECREMEHGPISMHRLMLAMTATTSALLAAWFLPPRRPAPAGTTETAHAPQSARARARLFRLISSLLHCPGAARPASCAVEGARGADETPSAAHNVSS